MREEEERAVHSTLQSSISSCGFWSKAEFSGSLLPLYHTYLNGLPHMTLTTTTNTGKTVTDSRSYRQTSLMKEPDSSYKAAAGKTASKEYVSSSSKVKSERDNVEQNAKSKALCTSDSTCTTPYSFYYKGDTASRRYVTSSRKIKSGRENEGHNAKNTPKRTTKSSITSSDTSCKAATGGCITATEAYVSRDHVRVTPLKDVKSEREDGYPAKSKPTHLSRVGTCSKPHAGTEENVSRKQPSPLLEVKSEKREDGYAAKSKPTHLSRVGTCSKPHAGMEGNVSRKHASPLLEVKSEKREDGYAAKSTLISRGSAQYTPPRHSRGREERYQLLVDSTLVKRGGQEGRNRRRDSTSPLHSIAIERKLKMHATSGDRCNRHSTPKPRLLFSPSPSLNKSPYQKGREFEDYFKSGVAQANGITSKVEFQKKLDTAPGDTRGFCRPDAVFTKGEKAAVVEMKNYEKSHLGRTQVDKTIRDMNAVKAKTCCREVGGYMYVRLETKVNQEVEEYAKKNGIVIVREGEIDADKLAELVDSELKN